MKCNILPIIRKNDHELAFKASLTYQLHEYHLRWIKPHCKLLNLLQFSTRYCYMQRGVQQLFLLERLPL